MTNRKKNERRSKRKTPEPKREVGEFTEPGVWWLAIGMGLFGP